MSSSHNMNAFFPITDDIISLYTKNDFQRRRFVSLRYFIHFELQKNLQTFEILMYSVNILTLNAYYFKPNLEQLTEKIHYILKKPTIS